MSDSVRPHGWQPTRLPHPWDSPGKNTGVGCHVLLQCMKVKSDSELTQSCLTLSDPMDCSLPGSSVHGIFQARVLEWGAIVFSDILCSHSNTYLLKVQRKDEWMNCWVNLDWLPGRKVEVMKKKEKWRQCCCFIAFQAGLNPPENVFFHPFFF